MPRRKLLIYILIVFCNTPENYPIFMQIKIKPTPGLLRYILVDEKSGHLELEQGGQSKKNFVT